MPGRNPANETGIGSVQVKQGERIDWGEWDRCQARLCKSVGTKFRLDEDKNIDET